MNCQDHLLSQCRPAAWSAGAGFSSNAASGSVRSRWADLLQGRRVCRGARQVHAAIGPLAPKAPHHAPKAKRVLFLFMAGAPSHLELFDNKPQLAKFDGTLPPPELIKGYRAAFIKPSSKLLGPKFKFARHGQSGTELSELLPHLATRRRRHRRRQRDGHRRLQPRPGPDHDEHRLADLRPAEHRGLGLLRPGKRVAGPARLRRFQHRARKGPAAAIRTGAAASCRPSTRASSSATAAIRCCICPIPRGVDARAPARLARRRSTSSTALRLERGGRSRDRHPDQLVRDGLPHAA